MQPQLATRRHGVRWLGPAALGGLLLLLLGWCHGALAASTPSSLFPLPEALRPNVTFWKRAFAVFDSSGGMLHDTEDVSIVYHIWYNDLPSEGFLRQGAIDEARIRYRAILSTLADGKRFDFTSDEQRVWDMFKGKQYPGAFQAAMSSMRFQGGMRSRFAESIVRSWSYLPELEQIFAQEGVPIELTRLPHIESSFENRALSKVGAAGMWQIMPATGRRYLRVGGGVDERLHIPTATRAAAQILRENYERLGNWPLAITAYNHGANGMAQAVDTVGTTDFGIIVQRYRGPLFGFASRNFYAEFLAALDLSQNYKHYFGDLLFAEPSRPGALEARTLGEPSTYPGTYTGTYTSPSTSFVAPSRPVTLEARMVGERNPAIASPPHFESPLQPRHVEPPPSLGVESTPMPVVARSLPVEPSSEIYQSPMVVPSPAPPAMRPAPPEPAPLVQTPPPAPPAMRPAPPEPAPLAQTPPMVRPSSVPAATVQPPLEPRTVARVMPAVSPSPAPTPPVAPDKTYRVRSGETLSTIAQRHDTTVAALASMNGLSQRASVKTGQTLRLPAAPQPVVSAEKTPQKGVILPVMAPVKSAAALPVQRTVLTEITPVPTPAPAEDRFHVKGNTIRVAAQEQLSQYADWLDVPVQRLLTLNRLSQRQVPAMGTALRLDFSKVSTTQFTQQRLQYHRSLEEAFLRRYRVGEVVTRKLRPGETLVSVSREANGVPLWLLQRYNTHVDPNAARPGTELRIPKVVGKMS
jgi:membrane-bound lytic murein transglycosylase D